MAAYATVPPDDPFAVSKAMFAALADELAGPAAAGMTACELEELIDEESRKAVLQLVQDHYDLRALREEQQARKHPVPVAGTDGITRTRLETGHGRLLATLFGTVRVTRCAWRLPGAPDYCLADAALSLPARRHSHSLAKLAALEAARGWFDGAHDAIASRCGPVIGKPQIEESVLNAAADIPAFCAARVPEPCTPETLLVMSADCKGIVMRLGALRAATAKAAARPGKMRTRLAGGEKPIRKRMAALVTVYDAEPAKRRPHDIIAPPGGRTGQREVRPGPKACAKWLTGSVEMDAEQVIAAVVATCRQNRVRDGYIRLVVTRGVGTLGLNPNLCKNPSVIIIAGKIQLYPPELYEKGMEIVTVPTVRNLQNALDVLQIVQARVDAGAASALDLAQQQTVVAQQRAAIPPLETQGRQSANALALLLGAAPAAASPPPTSRKATAPGPAPATASA